MMKKKSLHGRNVANFEILTSYLISFGDNYNPADNKLQISHLQELLTEAEKNVQLVRFYRIIYENIYDTINIQLFIIKELCKKLVEVLETSDVNSMITNEAKKLNFMVQNESIKNITEIEKYSQTKADDNYIITKQQFCILIDSFLKKIVKNKVELLYIRAKDNMIISDLFSKLDIFKKLDSSLLHASINYQNAIYKRNEVIYSFDKGLIDIALEIRLYIKRYTKSNSRMYRLIKDIRFNNIKWDS